MLFLLISLGFSFQLRLSLDTHVHYQTRGIINPLQWDSRSIHPEDTREHLESVLRLDYLEHFFLLSEAYLEDSLEEAITRNQEVFAISQREPRAIPVCGLDLQKKFYQRVFDHCLSKEYSVGIKMHLAQSKTFLDEEVFQKLSGLLQKVGNKNLFFLIHFHSSTIERNKNNLQSDYLYLLSRLYPSVNFIIAHAANGNIDMLQSLAFFQKNVPEADRNIYLETSTLFNSFHRDTRGEHRNYYGHSLSEYRSVFQDFGFTKILYGSDTFVTNPVNRKQIDFILNSSFTFFEQELLLEKNGDDFLKRLYPL